MAVPIIKVHPHQIGLLGVSIGPQPDTGGGQEPKGMTTIPIIEVNWFDERQTCPLVQDHVAAEREDTCAMPPVFEDCDQYSGGECLRMSGNVCAFHEAADADVWTKARRWKRGPDGSLYDRGAWHLIPEPEKGDQPIESPAV